MKRMLIAVTLFAASIASAQVETMPPPPGPPHAMHIPQPAEKTLANGLRVIVVPKHGVPLVAARLLVATGAEADPANLPGLADMTGSLLTKGTKTKTAEQIARDVEALGASLDSGAGWDASYVATSVMSSKLSKVMTYMSDVVRNPSFAKEEIERLRAQNLDDLQVAMGRPSSLASMVTAKAVFGATPYGHSVGGTIQSLQKISRDDVVAFHRAHYGPRNAVLVLTGDIEPARAFELAKTNFGEWKSSAEPSKPVTLAANALPQPRVIVIDMPQAGQAAVVVARPGLRRADPAYFQAEVANSVLGGGYSSRLNEEIRIKRGLSYGAGSGFDVRRGVGPFVARVQTKNESAAEVAKLVLDELGKLRADAVPQDELTPRKATLEGDFGRSLETNAGLASAVGSLALNGLPLDEINRYVTSVENISAADVQRFSTEHFAGDASVVIVGDASKFLDALKKDFKSVEVIPVAKLNLNSATLQ